MSSGRGKGEKRRPYEPPRLEKVEVRLDETVLVGCKSALNFGPSGAGCQSGGLPCSASNAS